MIEIDPQYSENWLKCKFLQKLRSDIRSRFERDTNLSLRELFSEAQSIEFTYEQQEIEKKLKQAVMQEKQDTATISTNNLFIQGVVSVSLWITMNRQTGAQYSVHTADHAHPSRNSHHDRFYKSS